MHHSTILGLALSLAVLSVAPQVTKADEAWEGFYFGGAVTSTSAKATGIGAGTAAGRTYEVDMSGSNAGGFIGYNLDFGAIILGAELSFLPSFAADKYNPYELTDHKENRLRVGYEVDRYLPYVFAATGVTSVNYDPPARCDGSCEREHNTWGLGVDYLLSQEVFVGAEMSSSSFTTTFRSGVWTEPMDIRTFSIRMGVKF